MIEPDQPSSPVCYAREADDAYAGYANREELISFCNLLLEAERAGAQVCARTAAEVGDSELRELLLSIGKDEGQYCAMLLKWLTHLGGEPSPRVGGFYEKCIAIADVAQRVAFLNRGQIWVVKRIREMLPKIRDDAMYADFSGMLDKHEENIVRAQPAR